jgi:hypothetical protein
MVIKTKKNGPQVRACRWHHAASEIEEPSARPGGSSEMNEHCGSSCAGVVAALYWITRRAAGLWFFWAVAEYL